MPKRSMYKLIVIVYFIIRIFFWGQNSNISCGLHGLDPYRLEAQNFAEVKDGLD